MKKLYSTIMMLAMMVAALSLTACGGDDDDIVSDGSSSFLVGTWSLTSAQGWGLESDGEPEYLQLKSDGTYINVQFDDGLYITKGTWRATDTELIMKETEGKIKSTYTYKILNHTQSSLTLEMWGITGNLTKVPDSTIDKYLDGSVNHYEGNSSSSTFTIIYDEEGEEVFTYDSDISFQFLSAKFENVKRGDSPRGSYFGMYLGTNGYFYIIFPYQKYGEDLPPSYFSIGYSDFGADATDMERVLGGSGWHGEHISGSAKVTNNDGKYITINFNNYKYSVTSGINTSRKVYVTLKGSLAFKNLYKQ